MRKQTWALLLMVIVLVTALPACSKSASGALAATPTVNNGLPFATSLPTNSISAIKAGTQTAEALLNPNATNPVAVSMTPAATSAGSSVTQAAATSTNASTSATTVVVTTAPTATKIIVPTATPGRPSTYTLHSGEYPYCIARRFNLNASDLLSLNGLNLNSRPAAGTVLKIPQSGTWSSGARALKSHPTTYTVSSGETIYTIACSFGDVDPSAIVTANALQSPYTLTAGETLNIP